MAGPRANPLLPNSSEMAWNLETPFYSKDSGILRMGYVNFHKPIWPRDFFLTIYYFLVQVLVFHVGRGRWVIYSLEKNGHKGPQPPSPANCAETMISPKHQSRRRAIFPEGPETSTAANLPGPKSQLVIVIDLFLKCVAKQSGCLYLQITSLYDKYSTQIF